MLYLDVAQQNTGQLNNYTYSLGDLVFYTLAQNPLEHKWVSEVLCLKIKG